MNTQKLIEFIEKKTGVFSQKPSKGCNYLNEKENEAWGEGYLWGAYETYHEILQFIKENQDEDSRRDN